MASIKYIKNMKTKHKIFLAIMFMALLAGMMGGCTSKSAEKPCPVYYDGEGNPLPEHAIRLLIKSQYVIMTSDERDTITCYFHQ